MKKVLLTMAIMVIIVGLHAQKPQKPDSIKINGRWIVKGLIKRLNNANVQTLPIGYRDATVVVEQPVVNFSGNVSLGDTRSIRNTDTVPRSFSLAGKPITTQDVVDSIVPDAPLSPLEFKRQVVKNAVAWHKTSSHFENTGLIFGSWSDSVLTRKKFNPILMYYSEASIQCGDANMGAKYLTLYADTTVTVPDFREVSLTGLHAFQEMRGLKAENDTTFSMMDADVGTPWAYSDSFHSAWEVHQDTSIIAASYDNGLWDDDGEGLYDYKVMMADNAPQYWEAPMYTLSDAITGTFTLPPGGSLVLRRPDGAGPSYLIDQAIPEVDSFVTFRIPDLMQTAQDTTCPACQQAAIDTVVFFIMDQIPEDFNYCQNILFNGTLAIYNSATDQGMPLFNHEDILLSHDRDSVWDAQIVYPGSDTLLGSAAQAPCHVLSVAGGIVSEGRPMVNAATQLWSGSSTPPSPTGEEVVILQNVEKVYPNTVIQISFNEHTIPRCDRWELVAPEGGIVVEENYEVVPIGDPWLIAGIHNNEVQGIRLYPNPTTGTITSSEDGVLSSLDGKVIGPLQKGVNRLEGLSSGVYVFTTARGTHRIIVQR